MRDFRKWEFDAYDLGRGKVLYISQTYGHENLIYSYDIDPAIKLYYIKLDKPYEVDGLYHKNGNSFRIAYCKQGLYITNMGNYQITVSSNSIYLGRSSRTSNYAKTFSQTCRAFNLNFYPDRIGDCQGDNVIGIRDIYKKLKEKLSHIELNGIHIKSRDTVSSASRLVDTLALEDKTLINLCLYELLHLICLEDFEKINSNYYSLGNNKKDYLEKIVVYIKENLDKDLSLALLCKKFDLSKNKLTSYFKEFYSLSPYQCIRILRMTKAQNLIETTDLTITEIASLVGYDNSSNFLRSFKDFTGKSPSLYRNN